MAEKSLSEGDCRLLELEAVLAIYEEEVEVSMDEDNLLSYRIKLDDIGAVLSLKLSAEYPEVLPSITVEISSSSEQSPELGQLEQHLLNQAMGMLGEVMTYNLIEEAKTWATENKSTVSTATENMTNSDEKVVCKFFLGGKCRFGDNCHNIHEGHAAKLNDAKRKANDSKDEETSHNHFKTKWNADEMSSGVSKQGIGSCNSSEKSNSLSEQKEKNTKKASMKTADDVISRIQWDDKTDASKFTVGYLDRFVGIIEKPFDSFCWEDIASVDYNVLSIPRHRIQYFKYCEEIVWDKRERLDNVFGSTGSGVTIYDIVDRVLLDNKAKLSNAEEKRDTEIKENDDYEEALQSFQVELEVEDLSGRCRSDRRKKEDNVPNYFLAFKVDDEEIVRNIDKLQKDLLNKNPSFSKSLITPQTLHITLLMLTIRNDSELTQVKNILQGLHHCLPAVVSPTQNLTYKNVGSFKDRILYINLENDESLQKWIHIVKSKLQENGIKLEGNREKFVPHLTVARSPANSILSPAERRKTLAQVEARFSGVVFGKQSINHVGLYSRFEQRNADGFYHEAFGFKNSFFAVLPSLRSKILNYLGNCEEFDAVFKRKVMAFLDDDATMDGALDALISGQRRIKK